MSPFNKFTALATMLVVAVTSASSHQGGMESEDINRRQLLQDIDQRQLLEENGLVLFKKISEYVTGESESKWCAQLPTSKFQMICDIKGISQKYIESFRPISGQSVMKIQGASLQRSPDSNLRLDITDEASVRIERLPQNDARYQGQTLDEKPGRPFGTKKVLVARVTNNGVSHEADDNAILNATFQGSLSMKSQFAACSRNQLDLQPTAVTNSGLLELSINIESSDGSSLEHAAVDVLYEQYGDAVDSSDLIVLCLPPFVPEIAAYAFLGGWWSFYNFHYCTDVPTVLHEIGHNFRLEHSGMGDNGYGDGIGVMGWSSPDGFRQCFNAVKNFALGWFDNQVATVNPLDWAGSSRTFVFTGIEQYQAIGSANKLITLQLDAGSEGDWYIGYNEAVGANADTAEALNQVAVSYVYPLSDDEYRDLPSAKQSWRQAALAVGNVYGINNFGGTEYGVYVKFVSLVGTDATVEVITSTTPVLSCGGLGRFRIGLLTDAKGYETSWFLRDSNGTVIDHYDDGKYWYKHQYYYPSAESSYCLPPGCYQFEIRDSGGDGLTDDAWDPIEGHGRYDGTLDGVEIFSGAEFGYNEVNDFCIEAAPVPTLEPTAEPVPTLVPAPTAPPSMGCEDDGTFKFRGKNNKMCGKRWMQKYTRNLNKRKRRKLRRLCKKKSEGKQVFTFCRATCALVDLGPCA
ncbi:unnamed protein product [Pseudo-nitzschia multistriata]|uniref:Peptidase M11 gametolysin domain-containing protein n=1 Tax=Pseudo-nitzschia multistriata TaxID=183589 RepID=A0A448Z3Z3_9STRA|nr:unnamed protein product [Pseudo-nitzschia multistriata]